MKKIFFYLLLSPVSLFFVTDSFSQVSKGEIYLGAILNGKSNHNEDIISDDISDIGNLWTTRKISVIPRVSVGLGQQFILGGGIGYSYSKIKWVTTNGNAAQDGWVESNLNKVVLDLFVTKFHEFLPNVGISLTLGTRYSWGRDVQELRDATDPNGPLILPYKPNVSVFTASVRPGIYYKAGKRFLLDVKFGGLSYVNSLNGQVMRR
jgi:hypothetical protein